MAEDPASSTEDPVIAPDEAEVTSERDRTRPLGRESRAAQLETDRVGRRVVAGDVLGRYMILRPLASGGMSHVYVAYDPELDREVALKVMRPGGPEGQSAASGRLLREAQAMARLEHVNVARVYDVGVVDDRVYMAMELVRGENLEEWLARRQRSWREVVKVLVSAGRGLAAAHAAGLVHLDFKPRNVMVGDDGEVRVVDFGLARPPRTHEPSARIDIERSQDSPAGRLTEQVTEYGLVMGTPGYMAAEQLTGGLADARTDQFAFCVTMWTALFRQRPFAGKSSSELNIAVRKGRIEPPPVGNDVPGWMRRLLERGLSLSAANRHASMQALLDALADDPAVRRRKVGAALGVGALVVTAAWGYTRPGGGSGPSCDGAIEHLDGVWDDERRDAVAAAFARDDRAFVRETTEKVAARLDAHAEAWVTMHDDSCRATHKRGEQSAKMLDLRTQCLMERLAELRAVTDLLVVADREVVESAVRTVGSLGDIDACGEGTRLANRDALPEDTNRRAEIEHAQELVHRARVFDSAGKYTIGLVYGSAAMACAETTGHVPTIADARFAYAALLSEYGDSATAQDLTLEAIHVAERNGLDEHRAHGLIDLVFITGTLEGRVPESERWARMADAVLDRIDATAGQRVRLLSTKAAIAGTIGDAERSIALYREALAIHESSGMGTDENVASMYLGLGSAHFWRNRYDDALPYYALALRIIEAELGPEHPRTSTAFENLGAVHHAMGAYEDAYRYFMRAYEVSEGSETAPERLGTLYNGIGAALEGLERLDEAEVWFRRAVQVIDAKALVIPALGITLANLGGNLVQQGRARDAVPLFQRGLAIMRETFAPGNIYLSVIECQAGLAHLETGDVDEALVLIAPSIVRYEGDDPEHDALYRGECRLAFAAALEAASGELSSEARVAAAGRTAAQWADLAERDLLAVAPRSKQALKRLQRFRRHARSSD